MKLPHLRIDVRIALLYALFGGLWIVVTDQYLLTRVVDGALLTVFQTYKGWLYVALSALLILYLLRREFFLRRVIESNYLESEERYRILFENSLDGVLLCGLDGRIYMANPAACRMFGRSEAELQRIGLKSLVDQSDPRLTSALEEWATAESYHGEMTFLRPDGAPVPCEISTVIYRVQDGTRTGLIIRDVTERAQTDHALRASERKYRSLFDQYHDAIFILDLQGRHLDANQRAADMLGYTHEELLSLSVWETSAEPVASQNVLERLLRGEQLPIYERIFRKKDGERIACEINAELVRDLHGTPLHIQTAVRDITERKRAEDALRRRADEAAALYQTAGDLSAQHDLDVILRTIVERACTLLHAPGGGVYLYDPAHGELELFLTVGVNFETGTRIQLGEGMAGRVAQTRQPLVVDDYQSWEGRSEKFRHVHFRAVIQAPMLFGGELIGVLSVHEWSESSRKFTLADAHLLTLFSEFAASAVHTARLLQQTQRRAEETTALLEASLALSHLDPNATLHTISQYAQTLFSADGCRIFLIEPNGEYLRCVLALHEDFSAFRHLRVKVGQGVTGSVAVRGQAEIVNDMLHDPRSITVPGTPEEPESIMFAPLKEQSRTIGVLSIRRSGADRPFHPPDLDLLEAFASMAASAVSNAHLLEQTQNRLDRLSTLRQIDQVITSGLDLNVTLNIVLGHIMQQLQVDAVAVLLYHSQLQSLEFVAGKGFHTQALRGTHLRLGQGFAGVAALEQRMVSVFDADQLRAGFSRSSNFHNEQFVVYFGVPLIVKGHVNGVVEVYHRQPLDPDAEWMAFLNTLAGQIAIAIDNITLFNDIQRSNLVLAQAYEATIEGWGRALELRDIESPGHSRRVVQMTLDLARQVGLSEEKLAHIRRGVLLHDVGKMGVPDAILHKVGPLTDQEWDIIRSHPVHAFQMLNAIPYLRPAMDIPYCHHERWDGSGYPRGLKGDDIPLAARIFAIVDVYDTLTNERNYRPAWPPERALAYIREQSGKHFDPKIAEVFLHGLLQQAADD